MILSWQECVGRETLVVTNKGLRPIAELADGELHALRVPNKQGMGTWQNCEVHCYGEQDLMLITLERHGREKQIRATAHHRWFVRKARQGLKSEVYTEDLVPGDRLVPLTGRLTNRIVPSSWGIAHGFTFGDGHRPFQEHQQTGSGCRANLFGSKDEQLLKFFGQSRTKYYPADQKYAVSRIEILDLPKYWKDPPDISLDSSYLLGWLAGYFAADGDIGKAGNCSIVSRSVEGLLAAQDICYRLGINSLGITKKWVVLPFLGDDPVEVWSLRFPVGGFPLRALLIDEHRIRYRKRTWNGQVSDWLVTNIEPGGRGSVYCAVVPGSQSFALADHILTGNSLPKDEQPPEWMWSLDQQLEEWFDEVERSRAEKYGGNSGDSTPPLDQNVYALHKKRELRRSRR